MSDEHLIKMSEKLGTLTGVLETHIKSQQRCWEQQNTLNEKLTTLISDNKDTCQSAHHKADEGLKWHKRYWKAAGAIVSAGGLGTIGTFLSKIGGGH